MIGGWSSKPYHRPACFDPDQGPNGGWRSVEGSKGIGMMRLYTWDETIGEDGGWRSTLCSEVEEE